MEPRVGGLAAEGAGEERHGKGEGRGEAAGGGADRAGKRYFSHGRAGSRSGC